MDKHKRYYHGKKVLNLVIRERLVPLDSKAIPLFFVALVAIAFFSKFAVADRLAAIHQAESRVTAMEQQIDTLKLRNADYDAVRAEYSRYFSEISTEEAVVADVLDVLDTVENYLLPAGQVAAASYSGDQMTVLLYGVDLPGTSTLISQLNALPTIGSVSVSSVDTEGAGAQKSQSALSMTIRFVAGGDGA